MASNGWIPSSFWISPQAFSLPPYLCMGKKPANLKNNMEGHPEKKITSGGIFAKRTGKKLLHPKMHLCFFKKKIGR